MNRLKELRQQKGVTLDKLSNELKKYGLSLSTGQLSSYENDKRSPRDNSTWEFLAKYFNVPVSYLLGYDDNDFEKRIRIDVLNDIINKLHKTHISLFETTDKTAFWAGFEAAELIVQTQKMILEIEEEEN
ncbi:helix-turn-helix domain-containing protein [Streptococcus gallolyticus]|uniref:helix-turn-helix domain-containing protein n=1 Tax=Streptococcus gallolyticus TaxID=315405 RepID=UPI00201B2F72|nr:helix-turn-helix transcriptional regulator [Streptococcus gallolyticus]MCL4890682.1 helix-turn-helix domain-containing protein [Streptococcus gallolyticus]